MQHKEVPGIFSRKLNNKQFTTTRKLFTSNPPTNCLNDCPQLHNHSTTPSEHIHYRKCKNRKQFTAGFQPSISSKLEPHSIQDDTQPRLKKIESNRIGTN